MQQVIHLSITTNVTSQKRNGRNSVLKFFSQGLEEMLKGSLHRKQKNSYGTSGINPKNLDLLDASSNKEMNLYP